MYAEVRQLLEASRGTPAKRHRGRDDDDGEVGGVAQSAVFEIFPTAEALIGQGRSHSNCRPHNGRYASAIC